LLLVACWPGACAPAAPEGSDGPSELSPTGHPNILIIVVDDLGYTDLGVYGGEIGTPNLDVLARSGVLFTRFYSAPTCSPTRAMLLTGTDHHLAGLGTMAGDHTPNQRDQPGYEGYLNFRVVTVAELLRDAGYHTYMTGKWHLGLEEKTGPANRGFERSFALLPGGGGHFDDLDLRAGHAGAVYREDSVLTALPDDFYSTRFYAERMIEYIDGGRADGRPFFAYLAFTAPHWPLQAPDSSIARYAGAYDGGYDELLTERLERLQSLGLLSAEVQPPARLPGEPAWEELTEEERRVEARKMEIFAAMVHDLDLYVGRVLDYLKRIGEYEKTFIFFMSDNGAEGHDLEAYWPELGPAIRECCDNSLQNMGRADSYIYYGPNWARAGVGPSRLFKGFTTEGGILVPAFVSFPAGLAGGRRYGAVASVMDLMPTVLDLAGVSHPGSSFRGREVEPMRGGSMLPMLIGEADRVHEPDNVMGWELFGRRAIRQGDWKLVWTTHPFGPDDWGLFNLAEDPAESRDLSSRHADRRRELIGLWDRYVEEVGVMLPSEPMRTY
jgi:arylsulfatase